MATTGNLPETVCRFIRSHVEKTGSFPKTYEIARGRNIQDSTAETVLKVLEARGLIERQTGKRRGYQLVNSSARSNGKA